MKIDKNMLKLCNNEDEKEIMLLSDEIFDLILHLFKKKSESVVLNAVFHVNAILLAIGDVNRMDKEKNSKEDYAATLGYALAKQVLIYIEKIEKGELR